MAVAPARSAKRKTVDGATISGRAIQVLRWAACRLRSHHAWATVAISAKVGHKAPPSRLAATAWRRASASSSQRRYPASVGGTSWEARPGASPADWSLLRAA